ncbi:MAG TPA: hypothetical protein VG602_07665 [Actinomycetota bacterium]|nr:hypothetical protein [Actinomycetota bacterium]
MADIHVEPAGNGYSVRVSEGGTETRHEVTIGDAKELAAGYASEAEFVRACFEFLLAREPKEQILRTFDIPVIARYFPEFEEEIRGPVG